MLVLSMVVRPDEIKAQDFTYTTNNGITRYTGSAGARPSYYH